MKRPVWSGKGQSRAASSNTGLAAGAAIVMGLTLAACGGSPSTSIQYGGTTTMHLSGQITGTFQHNANCIVGGSGRGTLAISFKATSSHVSGGTGSMSFSMIINTSASGGSVTFPLASETSSVFMENASGPIAYQWGAGIAVLFRGSAGTMTVSNGGSSGSVNLTLTPTVIPANKATGSIYVRGSWTGCPQSPSAA